MEPAPIRRVVLDLLKPHEPSTIEFAREIAGVEGVTGVNAMVIEVDAEVENIKVTVEGDAIDFPAVEAAVAELGGSLHSVDQVACGEHLIEESETPQD
jgi:hypothetical protein